MGTAVGASAGLPAASSRISCAIAAAEPGTDAVVTAVAVGNGGEVALKRGSEGASSVAAAAGKALGPAMSSSATKTAAASAVPCCGALADGDADAGVAIVPVAAGSDGAAVDGVVVAADAVGRGVDAAAGAAVPTVTSESADVSV